jgi:hypothetical protein
MTRAGLPLDPVRKVGDGVIGVRRSPCRGARRLRYGHDGRQEQQIDFAQPGLVHDAGLAQSLDRHASPNRRAVRNILGA